MEQGHFFIHATPSRALSDEPISIVVTGATAGQLVEVEARMVDDSGAPWSSRGYYRASPEGSVELSTTEAQQGSSYGGVHGMGLFWSMACEKGPRLFIKHKVYKPDRVTITARPAARDSDAAHATTTVERLGVAEGVERIDVTLEEAGIMASLFIPPGGGRHPGVLDLKGTMPGVTVNRAALLASHGFCALALGYHGVPGLPGLTGVSFEYFRRAVAWLVSHPRVARGGVGVIGISHGAMNALWIASLIEDVKVCVCINGPTVLTHSDPSTAISAEHGVTAPSPRRSLSNYDDEFTMDLVQHVSTGGSFTDSEFMNVMWNRHGARVSARDMGPGAPPLACFCLRGTMRKQMALRPELFDAVIEAERSNAKFVFVVGAADEMCDNSFMALLSMERLRKLGRPGVYDKAEVLTYPLAGHLMNPPYRPISLRSLNRPLSKTLRERAPKDIKISIEYGGTLEGHAVAEEACWARCLAAFRENLPPRSPASAL